MNCLIVGKIENHNGSSNLESTVTVHGIASQQSGVPTKLITDSGVSKTLLDYNDWFAIKQQPGLVKTSKGFRPYGTAYKLSIIGRAHVMLTAEAGAKINTWVYVAKDSKSDIVVYGTRDNHNGFLRNTLTTLQEKGITLCPDKCKLRKLEIKWFG